MHAHCDHVERNRLGKVAKEAQTRRTCFNAHFNFRVFSALNWPLQMYTSRLAGLATINARQPQARLRTLSLAVSFVMSPTILLYLT